MRLLLVFAAALLAHLAQLCLCEKPHTLLSTHHEKHIPHIIHQSWKTRTVPAMFQAWSATWREQYPEWLYQLWTDDDNRRLVNDHYPWFLDTYDKLPTNISRADAVRLLYMHQYGGIYADLDMEALRNMEEVLQGHRLLLGSMSTDEKFTHNIPNAWMASTQGHPMWLFCLQQVIYRQAWAVAHPDEEDVTIPEYITGPVLLFDCYNMYKKWKKGDMEGDVMVLPPSLVYPVDWREQRGKNWLPNLGDGTDYSVCNIHDQETFDADRCKRAFPDAYSITWWTHSWGR